ncbi:NADH-ubiquinone oxidoreductase-F iron-sulfur binding region domain-containing protein [Halobaculum roseum]|uniref:NADH-ubiquinone oxidoreductase-F iron-sulfur binding region domain-containing protein n=1 Tax=Halobaculum roseum TaxID=2175149 RepID=A0ABD5MIF2_9EURY|nr:NADH-ubiquinone oxidoreductase-F iron-sulfur binding region domain-containing protein [Halobaculum roseum]QZY02941.1 NADH dehydrogenase FAD-containing subunit [Halobaculum roseum]
MTTTDAAATTVRVAFDAPEGRAALEAARRAADAASDPDGPPIETLAVGSPGTVHLPLVAVTRGGRTVVHRSVDPNEAASLVSLLADGGDDLPVDGAAAVVDHEPAPEDFPVGDGPLSAGTRRTLRGAGWTDPTGFESPAVLGADALATVSDLGVRGRGWGDARQDEPVAEGWREARDADGDPVVVINGLDADPKADGDRLLLGSLTGRVVAGAVVAASAVDAGEVVAVVPEDDPIVADRVRSVADRVADETDLTVELVSVDADYMTAEHTAVLESLEGNDRIEARRRPPGPEAWGLFERPTLVHTPRTLAAVERAIADPDALDADAADPGTRLVTVVGPERRTVELPTDSSLSRALAAGEFGDRATGESEGTGGSGAFACVGGQFGGLTRDLDTPASAPALRGAGLGTNGSIEPFAAGTDGGCPVVVAGRRMRVAREDNCGRCVPCRTGSVRAHELLRDVYAGEFAESRLRELARTMERTSLCGFGTDAARPLATALDEFAADLRAHADGRCPAGVCDP